MTDTTKSLRSPKARSEISPGMRERHSDAARYLIYAEAADRAAGGLPNPPSHAERVYAAEQEGFFPMSAHAVALRAGGWVEEADLMASAAVDRAKLLRRRDQVTFANDPSPMRGDISSCRKWEDVERVRPSITLPAGMLRSLAFTGPELRASDLSLFWLMYAMSLGSGVSTLPWAKLKALAGAADHGRLRTALARLNGARISLINEPSIVRRRWIDNETVFRARLTDTSVAWAFSSHFVREARVERGGSRFAHLSIVAVRSFNTVSQERLYRAILAAATECGVWRGLGGALVWQMTPEHLAALTGLQQADVKQMRREHILPLAKRLMACNDRVIIDSLDVGARVKAAPGKPASRLDLLVSIRPAAEIERSKTARLREQIIGAGAAPLSARIVYVGPGGETERQKKRRKRAERHATAEAAELRPISPSVLNQVEIDEMEAIFAPFDDPDEPQIDIDAIVTAMRAAELKQPYAGGATPTQSGARQAGPPKMPKPSERHAAGQFIEARIQIAEEERAKMTMVNLAGIEGAMVCAPILSAACEPDRLIGDDADTDDQVEQDLSDAFGLEARAELDAEMWASDRGE